MSTRCVYTGRLWSDSAVQRLRQEPHQSGGGVTGRFGCRPVALVLFGYA